MNVHCLDKCVNVIKHDVPKLEVDGANGSGFYRPDIFETIGPEFRNYGGYPRNELAIINEQQSLQAAQVMCDKLVTLPDDSKLEKDVSDVELKLTLKSRYAQTPSEQIAHYERLLKMKEDYIAVQNQRKQKLAELKAREDLLNSLSDEEKAELERKKREREVESLIDE